MGKGGQATMEGTDTELSKICDDYLEKRTALQEARGEMHAVESNLIKLMGDSGKSSIKHDGFIIRLSHKDAKDVIQVKTTE